MTRSAWVVGLLLGLLLGVVSSASVFVLLRDMWDYCHLGISGGNGFALIFDHGQRLSSSPQSCQD